jgi:SAM-dependent methyltransferase
VRAGVSYFDWHGQPGYWADITRHFDPADRLLDLGCGTGWLAEHFANYTGLDGSPEAVAIAAGLGRNVVHGDLERPLPFAQGSFDAVVMKDVLEHLADPVALVSRARGLLRPGGLLFASSPDAQRWVWDDYTHRRPFTRRSFRLLFADHGFQVLRAGYESVFPGVGAISARTRRKRRPRVFALLALAPVHRRNVWLLARRPPDAALVSGEAPEDRFAAP